MALYVLTILQKKRLSLTSLAIDVEADHVTTEPKVFTAATFIYRLEGPDLAEGRRKKKQAYMGKFSAFGLAPRYHMGIGLLPASTLASFLRDTFGAPVPFYFGGAASILDNQQGFREQRRIKNKQSEKVAYRTTSPPCIYRGQHAVGNLRYFYIIANLI